MADGALASAQSSWFTAQAVLLIAGAIAALLYLRLKSAPTLLFATASLVIAAELLGRIAFYNLWAIPM